MSNIFRDSEFLGKSNGKKWSQIWTFLFLNCLKSPRKKKFFFYTFFGLLRFSIFFNGHFAPTSRSRMSNIFRDTESLGKSNGKKWSNIWTFLFGSGQKSPRKKKFFFLLILPWFTLLWHRCYYPHRSRDALSPVCGIFFMVRKGVMSRSKAKSSFFGGSKTASSKLAKLFLPQILWS